MSGIDMSGGDIMGISPVSFDIPSASSIDFMPDLTEANNAVKTDAAKYDEYLASLDDGEVESSGSRGIGKKTLGVASSAMSGVADTIKAFKDNSGWEEEKAKIAAANKVDMNQEDQDVRPKLTRMQSAQNQATAASFLTRDSQSNPYSNWLGMGLEYYS